MHINGYYMMQLTTELTNYLTAWERVLLEKLVVPKLVKIFSGFYGARSFIILFTRARHFSLL